MGLFPLLDHLNDPIVVFSRDGRIVELNNAFSEMVGVRKEDARGADCREMEPLNYLCDAITACLLHGREQSEQVTFMEKTFSANVIPVKNGGDARHICVTLRDISSFVSLQGEFLKRNKELMIANTLSGAFISSSNMEHVYHDLLEKILIISDLSIGWLVIKEEEGFTLKSAKRVSLEFMEALEGNELEFLFNAVSGSDDPLYVLEAERDEIPEALRREGIGFLSSIPLRVGGELLGIVMLASRTELTLDFDFASLLSLIGNNLSLIAEKIKLFLETKRLAVTDALTGLYNARYFYEKLDTEVARTERYTAPFSLLLFDIDDFKALNDTYGHQAGDEVLRVVAHVFKDTSRKTDIVARYGGEEFISILPNSEKKEAFNLATRIKEAIEETDLLEGENVKITLSGGVATFPEDAPDAKGLLYAADMAMYEAKAAGKRQIKCYAARKDKGKG